MSGYTVSSQPLINDLQDASHSTSGGGFGLAETHINMHQRSDNANHDCQSRNKILADKQEHLVTLSKDVRNTRKSFFVLAVLNIILICACLVLVIHHESDSSRQNVESIPSSVTSVEEIKMVVQEHLASDDSMRIVQKNIFCASCDTVKDVKHLFVKSADNTRCCIENIPTLIRLLNYTFSKGLNEYNSNLRSLKLSIEDLKEDTNSLENALFRSNKTGADDIPSESVMWTLVQKNNRLINTLLNRQRSVLHLSGTARGNVIHWTVELHSGVLSYDDNGIHVKSGGVYLILSNIHFSKTVCDGTESFGYSISQEYSPGQFLPIAQVQKGCAAGGRIDSAVHVQSMLQVGLGQHKTLILQYDKNNHKFLATENKMHHIIVFEI